MVIAFSTSEHIQSAAMDVRQQRSSTRPERTSHTWVRTCSRVFGSAVLVAVMAGCGGSTGESASSAAAHPGEATYTRYCFSCHAAGIAGAPRAGDAEQWAPRLAKGPEALLASTIAGIAPGMPARGLCSQCSDEDLANAIDYMTTPRD